MPRTTRWRSETVRPLRFTVVFDRLKVGLLHRRFCKIRTGQVRASQIRTIEVGSTQVDVEQVSVYEHRILQIHPVEIGARNVDAAQIKSQPNVSPQAPGFFAILLELQMYPELADYCLVHYSLSFYSCARLIVRTSDIRDFAIILTEVGTQGVCDRLALSSHDVLPSGDILLASKPEPVVSQTDEGVNPCYPNREVRLISELLRSPLESTPQIFLGIFEPSSVSICGLSHRQSRGTSRCNRRRHNRAQRGQYCAVPHYQPFLRDPHDNQREQSDGRNRSGTRRDPKPQVSTAREN